MAQSCTILCPVDEPKRVLDVIRELAPNDAKIQVEGKDGNWSAIKITNSGTSLTLNRLVQHEPGDKFSRMVLGMFNYFDHVKTSAKKVKKDVLDRVENLALAIGIVADPEFSDAANHDGLVFGVADALDGIVWNGNGVINSDGKMLLDGEGNCEVS